jgi:hypothetical protein
LPLVIDKQIITADVGVAQHEGAGQAADDPRKI